jgi:hypothetical protein
MADDVSNGGTGPNRDVKPSEAWAVCYHIKSLDPYLVFDTGDCKDAYGVNATTTAQHANYTSIVRDSGIMPWGTVNPRADVNATRPILPGNHDEVNDYTDAGTDFSMWNSNFWASPYHWTMDWPAPKVRFVAIHGTILHIDQATALGNAGLAGFYQMTAPEIQWMSDRVDELPSGWRAIVLTHAPIPGSNSEFGGGYATGIPNNQALRDAIAARSSRIIACLSGHRHQDQLQLNLSGVLHICSGSMAYTTNTFGSFNIIEYKNNKLRFHMRRGPSITNLAAYGRVKGLPIIEVAVPAQTATTGILAPLRVIRNAHTRT